MLIMPSGLQQLFSLKKNKKNLCPKQPSKTFNQTNNMASPQHGSYPHYYDTYVKLIEANSVDELIEKYSDSIFQFFKNIPKEKINYRYAESKWNLKEMLQHIIDTERIFAYRALTIARHDTTSLPGFDENTYAAASSADARKWKSLLKEYKAVRKSTNLLLKSFDDDQLQQSGTANGQPNTPLAISYIIFGHSLHHINVVKERYL